MTNPAIVFQAAHYAEAEQQFVQDPIVQGMARELIMANTNAADIMHDDRTPKFDFMTMANAEHHKRGGADAAHIGAIANAIIRLMRL